MKWFNRIFNATFALAWSALAAYMAPETGAFVAGTLAGLLWFAMSLDDRLRALERAAAELLATAKGGE